MKHTSALFIFSFLWIISSNTDAYSNQILQFANISLHNIVNKMLSLADINSYYSNIMRIYDDTTNFVKVTAADDPTDENVIRYNQSIIKYEFYKQILDNITTILISAEQNASVLFNCTVLQNCIEYNQNYFTNLNIPMTGFLSDASWWTRYTAISITAASTAYGWNHSYINPNDVQRLQVQKSIQAEAARIFTTFEYVSGITYTTRDDFLGVTPASTLSYMRPNFNFTKFSSSSWYTRTIQYPKNVIILFDGYSNTRLTTFELLSEMVLSYLRTINSNDIFNIFIYYGDGSGNTMIESLSGVMGLIYGSDANVILYRKLWLQYRTAQINYKGQGDTFKALLFSQQLLQNYSSNCPMLIFLHMGCCSSCSPLPSNIQSNTPLDPSIYVYVHSFSISDASFNVFKSNMLNTIPSACFFNLNSGYANISYISQIYYNDIFNYDPVINNYLTLYFNTDLNFNTSNIHISKPVISSSGQFYGVLSIQIMIAIFWNTNDYTKDWPGGNTIEIAIAFDGRVLFTDLYNFYDENLVVRGYFFADFLGDPTVAKSMLLDMATSPNGTIYYADCNRIYMKSLYYSFQYEPCKFIKYTIPNSLHMVYISNIYFDGSEVGLSTTTPFVKSLITNILYYMENEMKQARELNPCPAILTNAPRSTGRGLSWLWYTSTANVLYWDYDNVANKFTQCNNYRARYFLTVANITNFFRNIVPNTLPVSVINMAFLAHPQIGYIRTGTTDDGNYFRKSVELNIHHGYYPFKKFKYTADLVRTENAPALWLFYPFRTGKPDVIDTMFIFWASIDSSQFSSLYTEIIGVPIDPSIYDFNCIANYKCIIINSKLKVIYFFFSSIYNQNLFFSFPEVAQTLSNNFCNHTQYFYPDSCCQCNYIPGRRIVTLSSSFWGFAFKSRMPLFYKIIILILNFLTIRDTRSSCSDVYPCMRPYYLYSCNLPETYFTTNVSCSGTNSQIYMYPLQDTNMAFLMIPSNCYPSVNPERVLTDQNCSDVETVTVYHAHSLCTPPFVTTAPTCEPLP